MSLTALTVAASDIAQLEQGVQFFQSSAANQASVAASINAPGSTTSVFTYAASLLGQNSPSLGQVNMADTAILEGGTIPVGNATTTNTLTFLATSFLPAQFQVGSTLASLGVNPTLFASEALGLALASTAGFKAQYGNLTQAQFVSMISTQTGVGASFIQTFVTNWLNFYNGVGAPAVPPGLTATQAAFGATAGDAMGAAVLAPASLGLPLTTVISTQTPQTPTQFSPNTVKGQVANALIGNAEGQYVTGVALGSLPAHTPLQGEFTTPATQNVFLTTGVDNATQGFSTSSTGSPLLNGFTATASNTTFNGTVGGAGATWTPGDTIMAAPGTTGTPAVEQVSGDFQKIAGHPPLPYELTAYDALMIVLEGMKDAGSTDPTALRDALRKLDYKGVLQQYTFAGKNQSAVDININKVTDGRVVPISAIRT